MILIFNFLIILLTLFVNVSSNSKCDTLILTLFIESNEIHEARKLSVVKYLPNAPRIKNCIVYLTVNKKFESNMFY